MPSGSRSEPTPPCKEAAKAETWQLQHTAAAAAKATMWIFTRRWKPSAADVEKWKRLEAAKALVDYKPAWQPRIFIANFQTSTSSAFVFEHNSPYMLIDQVHPNIYGNVLHFGPAIGGSPYLLERNTRYAGTLTTTIVSVPANGALTDMSGNALTAGSSTSAALSTGHPDTSSATEAHPCRLELAQSC